MKRMLLLGALCMCLTLLAGCCGKGGTAIPEMLTEPTPEPEWEGVTNMDLAEHVLSLRHALGLCNSDKEAIRSLER